MKKQQQQNKKQQQKTTNKHKNVQNKHSTEQHRNRILLSCFQSHSYVQNRTES